MDDKASSGGQSDNSPPKFEFGTESSSEPIGFKFDTSSNSQDAKNLTQPDSSHAMESSKGPTFGMAPMRGELGNPSLSPNETQHIDSPAIEVNREVPDILPSVPQQSAPTLSSRTQPFAERNSDEKSQSKKWIILTTALAALWVLLAVLAENEATRQSLVNMSAGLSESINKAQLHEHFFGKAFQPINSEFDGTYRPGIGGFIMKVFEALKYTAEQAFTQGAGTTLFFLLSLAGAFLIVRKMEDDNNMSSLLNWILGLPLIAGGLMFLLKVVIVWLLGAFGAVVQLVGTFALAILTIEKVRGIFDLAKSGREIAEGVRGSVGQLRK